MANQLTRLIWWLGQNSAAVQAFAAIVTVILTAVLIVATVRYVSLTGKILRTTEAALRGGFMPDISANIEFTHPRRNELYVYLKNTAEPPIRIVRAKVIGGSVFKWTDPPNQQKPYSAEVRFGCSEIPPLASLFLRKNEETRGNVRIEPIEQMEERQWLDFIDNRVSLTATVIVEVSDVTGQVLYSFTVLRNAQTANTRIEMRFPSAFDAV